MNRIQTLRQWTAIALCSLLAASATADELLHASVTQVPVDAACRVVSELSGENVVFVGDAAKKVSFQLHGARFEEALTVLASRSALFVRRVGNVSILFEEQHRRFVEGMQEHNSPRISLHVDDRSLLWVVQAISRLSGAEIAFMGVPRTVHSLHLNDVPWEQLLDIIAAKYELRVERRKSTISLRDRS